MAQGAAQKGRDSGRSSDDRAAASGREDAVEARMAGTSMTFASTEIELSAEPKCSVPAWSRTRVAVRKTERARSHRSDQEFPQHRHLPFDSSLTGVGLSTLSHRRSMRERFVSRAFIQGSDKADLRLRADSTKQHK
jgi:hypothetical protein